MSKTKTLPKHRNRPVPGRVFRLRHGCIIHFYFPRRTRAGLCVGFATSGPGCPHMRTRAGRGGAEGGNAASALF